MLKLQELTIVTGLNDRITPPENLNLFKLHPL
jgi:hypothetical protein